MNVLKHPVLVRFLATFAAAICCVDAFLLDWSAAVGSGLGSVSGGNSLMGFTFSISKKRVPLEDGFHNQGLQGDARWIEYRQQTTAPKMGSGWDCGEIELNVSCLFVVHEPVRATDDI